MSKWGHPSHWVIDFKDLNDSDNLSGLKNLHRHDNLSGLNDLNSLFGLKKSKTAHTLHTKWFSWYQESQQPQWRQQPQWPQWPQWPWQPLLIKNLGELDVSINSSTKMTYPGLSMWNGSSKIHYFIDFWHSFYLRLWRPCVLFSTRAKSQESIAIKLGTCWKP